MRDMRTLGFRYQHAQNDFVENMRAIFAGIGDRLGELDAAVLRLMRDDDRIGIVLVSNDTELRSMLGRLLNDADRHAAEASRLISSATELANLIGAADELRKAGR